MEEVISLLTKARFDTEIVQIFISNKIDKSVLTMLTTEDMKELGIVALGDRKKLQTLIETVRRETRNSVQQTEPRLDEDLDSADRGEHSSEHSDLEVAETGIILVEDSAAPLHLTESSRFSSCSDIFLQIPTQQQAQKVYNTAVYIARVHDFFSSYNYTLCILYIYI